MRSEKDLELLSARGRCWYRLGPSRLSAPPSPSWGSLTRASWVHQGDSGLRRPPSSAKPRWPLAPLWPSPPPGRALSSPASSASVPASAGRIGRIPCQQGVSGGHVMPPDSTEGAAADAALERAIPHSTEPLGPPTEPKVSGSNPDGRADRRPGSAGNAVLDVRGAGRLDRPYLLQPHVRVREIVEEPPAPPSKTGTT